MADIVIVLSAVALVVFTVAYNMRKRRQGTCGCTSSTCRVGRCKGCSAQKGT